MSDAVSKWLGLLNAARDGDASTVRRLLADGAEVDSKDVFSGYTALHYAATGGHLEVVQLLVEAGATITEQQNTVYQSALAGAVLAGRTEIVAYLLAHGANPRERLYPDDATLLGEAERRGSEDIAGLLRTALKTAQDE